MKCNFVVYGLIALFAPLMMVSPEAQTGNANEHASPLLKVDSAFVMVPALVRSETGEVLSHPDASRFRLFDNGAPEKVTEINADGLPISLLILMQTGGSASRLLTAYADLPGLVGQLVGDSVHEITLVTFDSRVEEVWHFPARTDGVNYALTHQDTGDKGAAVKDAVAFGIQQLENEPGRFRRIILLLSQGTDVGSSIPSQFLFEQLGSSSTVVNCLTFPKEKMQAAQVLENRDAGSVDDQLKRINRAIDGKTAEEIAYLSGGTEFRFDSLRSFNSAMLETISDFHNEITLGFQPSHHEVGFHHIEVQVDSSNLRVTARRAYWWARPE